MRLGQCQNSLGNVGSRLVAARCETGPVVEVDDADGAVGIDDAVAAIDHDVQLLGGTRADLLQLLQVDVDATEFEKNVEANVHICADVADVLPKLYNLVEEKSYPEWYKQIAEWPIEEKPETEYHPKTIIHHINKAFEDAYVVTEVGQHQMWVGQHWKFKFPNQYITSGGLGTMGFGMGAAIGCQFAHPDKQVLLIAGDGSFRMNFTELTTIRRYNLPIKIFLFNNETLGMVRQWQKLFNDRRYAQTDLTDHAVDYLKLADAFNIKNYDVTDLKSLDQTLEEIAALLPMLRRFQRR